MKISPSTRNLIVAVVVAVSALLALCGSASGWISGELIGSELILSIVSMALLNIATTHSLYNSHQTRSKEVAKEKGSPAPADEKTIMKGSTHTTINSLLHLTAATTSLANDGQKLSTLSPFLLLRFAGTNLWFCAGLIGLLQAYVQYHKEKNPNETVRPCGIKPLKYKLYNQGQLSVAGFLYLTSALMNGMNPLFVVSSSLWIMSGLQGIQQTYSELDNDEKAAASVRVDAPIIIIQTDNRPAPKSSVTLEVLTDTKSEAIAQGNPQPIQTTVISVQPKF